MGTAREPGVQPAGTHFYQAPGSALGGVGAGKGRGGRDALWPRARGETDRLPSSGSSATSLKVGLRHGRAASPERLSQGRQAEAASLGAAAAQGELGSQPGSHNRG